MNYNLNLLKDKKVRTVFTRFVNGKRNEKEVIATLEKICGINQEPKEEGVVEVPEVGDPETNDIPVADPVVLSVSEVEEDYEKAINGKKADLEAFAEQYGLDVSGAKNNTERIAIIKDWFYTDA